MAPYNDPDKGVIVGVCLNLNYFLNRVLLRLWQLFAGDEKALDSL